MTTPRIAVLGTGHMGRFHALKLAARGCLAAIHDADPARAAAVAAETGAPARDASAAIAAADAVVLAVPTAHHHAHALRAIAAGRALLIEKPLAATLAEGQAILEAAATAGVPLMVGHIERHSAAWAAVMAGGPGRTALAWEAVRAAPFRPRGLDVSVVLDLMIHDLDLVLTLAAAPLAAVRAVGRRIASGQVDVAVAHLRFEDGTLATLTASRVSPSLERRLRVLSAEGELRVDFLTRALETLRPGGADPMPTLPGWGIDRATWTDHDSLEAEHTAFLAAIAGTAPPIPDGAAGLSALDAALRVERAIATGETA